MKNARLDVIKKLISSTCISSQEELQRLLGEEGIFVTQATLSRDLRVLGIVKSHNAKSGYCYKLPHENTVSAVSEGNHNFTVESIKSLEFGGPHAIIKTYPGFAGAVASIIDGNVREGIMGTLAGDDTVLLILREPYDQRALVAEISRYIKNLEDKVI